MVRFIYLYGEFDEEQKPYAIEDAFDKNDNASKI